MTNEEIQDESDAVALRFITDYTRIAIDSPAYRTLVAAIVAFGEQVREGERGRCIDFALCPYGDEVQTIAGDEPLAVGRKIANAIRAGGKRGKSRQASSQSKVAQGVLLEKAQHVLHLWKSTRLL